MKKGTAIGPVTNGAADTVESSVPYAVRVKITGSSELLFKRWNVEGVAAKAAAAKGSKAKKTDDVEGSVYRTDEGEIALPGEYLRQSIIHAAKFKQDPRSPRKSAMDLFKAGIISLTPLATLGKETWDYEHKARVQIQRNAITRVRPAFKSGWSAEVDLLVNLPEYISQDLLLGVLNDAGRLVGVGDFRPTYGRFQVTKFEALQEAA